MASQKFSNVASSLLAASITDTDTSIQVDAGYGALFPNPGAGEFFVIALENSAGLVEYCKVTARATDLFTVVRGWEDSVAEAWTLGVTRVEMRNTAGSMGQMIQRTGDVMEGDLDMDGNSIVDAVFEGDTVIEAGATIKGATITNANGDLTNAITIPDDGMTAPQVGGTTLLTVANFDPNSVFAAGMVMAYYGDLNNIPDGWALCDGNNGRPDLRDRFIVGAGGADYSIGDTGGVSGSDPIDTSSSGTHDHDGATAGHTLAITEIPAHTHSLAMQQFVDEIDNGTGKTYIVDGAGMSTGSAGGSNSHAHDIVDGGAHTHTIAADDVRPPYYALYFIIKVDPAGDYGGVGGGSGPTGDMYDMYEESGCRTYIGGRSTLMEDVAISGGNVQINCCASNVFRVQLSENVTMLTPNNPFSGQVINIIFKQSGAFTVSWGTVFKWAGGTPPTITTGAGEKDIISCQYDSADGVWYCSPQQSFS